MAVKTLKDVLTLSNPLNKSANKLIAKYIQSYVSKSLGNYLIKELSSLDTDSQLLRIKIQLYLDSLVYERTDIEKIQKAVNYTVVRYIKTIKEDNSEKAIMDHLRRWKWTMMLVTESSFESELNLKSFKAMNDELFGMLREIYS